MNIAQGFDIPKEDRYFEDYHVGAIYAFPERIPVSEADIIRFAQEFDPQFFHLDPVAAKNSPYKGLIASGAQTIALTFRLYIQNFLPGKASYGSPGIDETRWVKPVRPGDILHVKTTILEATPSKSKPDRGTLRVLVETFNQDDALVMRYIAINILAKRP